MSDINELWAGDPFNPQGRPDLDIKHRYPEWVQDSDGVIWEMSMTYYQINLDDPETRVLAVRYTSDEKTPFVVEQHILSRDFPKVEDYQYVKKRLEELQQMVEEKVNIRRSKPMMSVDGRPSAPTPEGLIAMRNEARKAQNFTEADRLRKQLNDMGIILEDTRSGKTRWRKGNA